MKRRDLLKAASAGVGAIAVAPFPAWAKQNPGGDERSADVVVVGGGTAGAIAAIQAARAGAKTVVVEMQAQLGGTTTTGGVAMPGLFHAWGKQIIAGIGWELVKAAVDLDGGAMPDFSSAPKHHWQQQIRINGPLYAALIEEAALAAGVEPWYHQFPLAVEAGADGWTLDVVGPGTRRTLRCRQLIDCTGGADVVGMIGLARRRGEETQPGTLIFRLGGYDAGRLDAADVERRYREALASGALQPGDYWHGQRAFMSFLHAAGWNAQHVHGADSSNAVLRTEANIAGRRSVLRLLRFVRSLPGCEKSRLVAMQQETAVRETYRIVGEIEITHEDYTSGRVFDDAVAYSFYPIDQHTQDGCTPRPLAPGVVPTVPLRALSPKGSRNVLVAGRCVSSDRLANSALRVQASSMAMGQAAGAAAALAAARRVSPLDVPLDEITAMLHKHGAIVPTA